MADANKNRPTESDVVPTTTAGLKALLKRTQSGDRTALPVVRKMLDEPYYLRVFGGELAETAIGSFINAMGGDDVGFAEAVHKKMELMRVELLGAGSTPVERLLVERIVACWLQVQDAEIRYAQGQKDMTLKQGEFRQHRIDAANRRFLAAVKTLALVRKLAVPALQVNIAKKQVNVVTPGAATG